MPSGQQRRRPRGVGAVVLTLIAVGLGAAAPAQGAFDDPLFTFSPQPPPPPALPQPAPTGYLDGPCGLAVDDSGRFYVSDHYHRAVDVYSSAAAFQSQPLAAFSQPNPHTGAVDDPCGLALDSAGTLYLNNYHRNVARFPSPTTLGTATVLAGSEGATGVAVDSASDDVYVAKRDEISTYDSSGAHQSDFGGADLDEAYGIAVSGFVGTGGRVYAPDASTDTVKVFDPPGYALNAGATIAGPPGGFASLRDSSVAVDEFSGDVYVLDRIDPPATEEPRARIQVFDSTGAYEGHLKYDVIDGAPTGIAVDNSPALRHPVGTQGRVYVTSGNTHRSAIHVYPPDAATRAAPLARTPPPLQGSGLLFPTVSIGGPGGGAGDCEGDGCQALPSAPADPTLTTTLAGRGNPRARYRSYSRSCGPLARKARKLNRRARGAKGARAAKLKRLARRAARLSRRCRRANRPKAGASAAVSPTGIATDEPAALGFGGSAPATAGSEVPLASIASSASAQGLLPGAAGFDAAVWAGGGVATEAGSHPYRLDLSIGLDQGGGDADLRELLLKLPPGLLLNPANGTGVLCSAADFATPRVTPFAAGSESGESCPDQTQVGTVEVASGIGGGQTRRFGLFNLQPRAGVAAQFGASPFGRPLVFDATIQAEVPGANAVLEAAEVPQDLQAESLGLEFWGVPWNASHNTQRGDCLNEEEPSFAWGKCSVGNPLTAKPRAFLTMPTECGAALSFEAVVGSWQEAGTQSAVAVNRDGGGDPAPVDSCGSLHFDFHPEGLLSVRKASSASGFVFRFRNDDDVFTDPRGRTQALVKRVSVELPDGVTLNPSLGAGLGVCSPGQLAAETAFNPPGAGCPNASKIGLFRVKLPYFENVLRGSIYLAQPDHPATSAPGAENPFDSLLAVYLVAKSADRGLLFRIPGKLTPDPGDGTLTATFDNLPQLPYTDLEVNFRSGQRAPIISPPYCGSPTTKITLASWAAGVPDDVGNVATPIETGIDAGPCPNGSIPPFAPEAIAGGANSNAGSYTPYFVRLSRKDTEQEITSYSLVLPKGITGKLAGVPFCPDAAIAAARHRLGFDETASPSCPAASQVGRTDTGYGVGAALTYAPGRIYLAGPYNGAPLSLVTINAATVGPFDLGTIVIRSAFQVNQRTAQLQIDSSASDPIPHIIDGIPLHLRDVRIYMDRHQFTHNPSSCEPSQLTSRLTGSGASFATSADDSVATVAKHFQLLNCLTLGFRPRLGLRLRGGVRRGAYPSLRASFVSRGARDSNLKRIEVEMPHSLFLAQNHIRTVCTRQLFAAERCPKGSIYGKAVARTLLFDEPLRGNVYLRSSSGKLPDLVADLRSGAVRITVEGRIGPGKHGGINTFFDNLPDAPIDSFTMTLFGGRRGLLQNSANICARPPLATVSGLGQNNIGARFSSTLRGQCKKKKKAKRRGHTRQRGGGTRR